VSVQRSPGASSDRFNESMPTMWEIETPEPLHKMPAIAGWSRFALFALSQGEECQRPADAVLARGRLQSRVAAVTRATQRANAMHPMMTT